MRGNICIANEKYFDLFLLLSARFLETLIRNNILDTFLLSLAHNAVHNIYKRMGFMKTF